MSSSDVEELIRLCAARAAERKNGQRGPAYDDLREFGADLQVRGGGALMTRVYDAAIEQHGHSSVVGAASAWTGIAGWSA